MDEREGGMGEVPWELQRGMKFATRKHFLATISTFAMDCEFFALLSFFLAMEKEKSLVLKFAFELHFFWFFNPFQKLLSPDPRRLIFCRSFFSTYVGHRWIIFRQE